ncbi:MAG: isoprenyl transferase [Proteobacteria bacterium]|nr:MAG: isoprenyl transferase [Pseudomonadota bacterium]
MNLLKQQNVPRHVAIIMDGNGRWAQRQGEARVFGHHSGATRVREVVETAGNMGVDYLTLYAFSEENWRRPDEEVSALFSLLITYLKGEVERLHENGVRLKSIGNIDRLPVDCQEWLKHVEVRTANNQGLTLVLALSYGARSDIVRACQSLAADVKNGLLDPSQIDEALLHSRLSTSLLPEPDLLIRTSGEQRLSNFLLWEMAYTEFYFTQVHWPDFSKEDFAAALSVYAERERRFGGLITP